MYLTERLDEEISRAYRDHYKLAVMVVKVDLPDDVDNYVRLARMDDLLYAVAQSIRANVRKMDVVARLGETCFALILPHTGSRVAVAAERLVPIVDSAGVDAGRGHKLSATARIGIARYPKDAASGLDLLEAAAKDLGFTLDELQGGAGEEEIRKAA